MAKNNSHNNNDQTQEPKPDHWYNITLGDSFTDPHPSKFCSLRYEFKPASVDKSQAGTLHKGKDSHVTVEYHNIQADRRPNVTFHGVSEDYNKENDAVLIFDGEGFRLERLHRAFKRLRHVRLPAATGNVSGLPVPVQVEQLQQIDARGTESSLGAESKEEKHSESPLVPSEPPPAFKRYDSDEDVNILDDDDDDEMDNVDSGSDKGGLRTGLDIDINNKPHQADGDDEMADVDISDDEADRGPTAAEALKAQVKSEKSSSSGCCSASESSRSGSDSRSSSDSEESSDGGSVI